MLPATDPWLITTGILASKVNADLGLGLFWIPRPTAPIDWILDKNEWAYWYDHGRL